MFLITRTAEMFTPESLEDGGAAESWVDYQDDEQSFREVVKGLEVLQPSCYPITLDNLERGCVWFTSYGEADYRTGETTNYSLHYSRSNPSRNMKHWIAAVKAAGFEVK